MNFTKVTYSTTILAGTNIGAESHSASTGKELDAETGYGYFGARYMDHELMTGWLSVDPMSDKYPNISPYAYCNWNPVKLIDPDGNEIYYKEGNDYYVYQKNKDGKYGFFNVKTKEEYNGGNQQYVNNLTSALGTLKDGKHGNNLVQFFEGSSSNNVFISKEGGNSHNNGRNVLWNDVERTMIPVGKELSDAVIAEENTPFVSLAHEMKHVKDYYRFGKDFESKSHKFKELSAMFTENLIRAEHGLRQRTYYQIDEYGIPDFKSYEAVTFPIFSKGDPLSALLNYISTQSLRK